jgi:hypothetical protein
MKYEDAMKLSREELKKLPKSELREALEDYADKHHVIVFDDSNIKI